MEKGDQNGNQVALAESAETESDYYDLYDELHDDDAAAAEVGETPSCSLRALPDRLQIKAAEVASSVNPMNMPALSAPGPALAAFDLLDPQRIAVLTSKYWGARPRTLSVSFMETTPADLRRRILSHLNAWTRTSGVSFAWTQGVGQVRISRGSGGYYSYLGTDVLLVPANRQTMNLERFTMNTPESEFVRVVRHEAGHTLGCPHEHMRRALVRRIDPQKAYDYFWRTQGWNKAMVDAQVLTPLDERSLLGTPADQTSIMCYQLPGSITRDGRPILGGRDINANDYAFMGRVYPKRSSAPGAGEEVHQHGSHDEWDEAEDVVLEDLMQI